MNALEMLSAILGAGFRVNFQHVQAPWDPEYNEAVEAWVVTKAGFVVYRTIQVYESDAIEMMYDWLKNKEQGQ